MTRSAIWHPMTQHKIFTEMLHIDRAQGAYLYTKDGRQIIDGISSWWVNTHGHCHPKIVSAVQTQAAKLEQVIFAGFTHDPAEKLSEKLIRTCRTSFGSSAHNGGLEHIFYSDSGSTAIEVALKMAVGYFEQIGETRRKIVALDGGYHGDTFGTMSAGSRCVFNEMYAPYLFDVQHLPFPSEGDTVAAFQNILEQGGVAALVLEPLVQGAAGMCIYSAEILRQLSDLCQKHDVLLIADEVMTGFGRTGAMFACEKAGIVPDLLCLSKGLTGGFLPMGATLCTRAIYDAFYDDSRARQFFHSTSFSGNPLACAAALASLEIWEEGHVHDDLDRIADSHEKAAENFQAIENITDIRSIGTVLALDLVDPNPGYLSDLGVQLYEFFLSRDILLRPIGNCIYVLPPYCTSDEDLQRIYDTITEAANLVAKNNLQNAA